MDVRIHVEIRVASELVQGEQKGGEKGWAEGLERRVWSTTVVGYLALLSSDMEHYCRRILLAYGSKQYCVIM